ncbi:MAG: 4'-phosphopantetheinyl transferase family protein [Gammaproteobacteria bacterium]
MAHTIELYSCRVTATDLPRLETRYLPCLHTEEQARYRRFTSARRGLEWLAGRALAWEALPLVLGQVNGPALRTGSSGNIVYQDAPVALSLSHSRGLFVLTIATVPTGVDVERVCMRSVVAYARQVFTSTEAAHIEQVAMSERPRVFCRYWTLKEAVCKAAGLSIWEGLAAAQFALQSAPAFTGTVEPLAGPWRFWSAGIKPHWQLAVVAHAALPAGAFTAWRIARPGSRERLELDTLSSFASG